MGACFQMMTLDGSKSRNEAKEAFQRAQDEDRYENGHDYSGGFGMAAGLQWGTMTFDSDEAAQLWLEDNCQKWGPAIGVTYKDDKGAARWAIGAWCAS
jgi:hypothetical protein